MLLTPLPLSQTVTPSRTPLERDVLYGRPLHWLHPHARIQFKIFTLIFKVQRGLALKYLVDVILHPHSASSNRPLRSPNRLDLLVPRSRTALAQSRSFSSIGPSLWNALYLSVCSTFL